MTETVLDRESILYNEIQSGIQLEQQTFSVLNNVFISCKWIFFLSIQFKEFYSGHVAPKVEHPHWFSGSGAKHFSQITTKLRVKGYLNQSTNKETFLQN